MHLPGDIGSDELKAYNAKYHRKCYQENRHSVCCHV